LAAPKGEPQEVASKQHTRPGLREDKVFKNEFDQVNILMGDPNHSGIEPSQVWASGKQPKVVQARSLLCYWATSELGISQAWLSKRLRLSQPAISLSVARGRAIATQNNYGIENL